jgi:hypothetical protein
LEGYAIVGPVKWIRKTGNEHFASFASFVMIIGWRKVPSIGCWRAFDSHNKLSCYDINEKTIVRSLWSTYVEVLTRVAVTDVGNETVVA